MICVNDSAVLQQYFHVMDCGMLGVWQLNLFIMIHTHTHTRLTALFPGLPGWAGTRTVKPIWILLKQETVSGSGISWAICKCAPCSRQITMPAPHHSVFLQAGCPSCRQTNSVKALKAKALKDYWSFLSVSFGHQFLIWHSFILCFRWHFCWQCSCYNFSAARFPVICQQHCPLPQ